VDVFHIGFLTITWIDIIDILLVTLLFSRLYIAMRGTIAAQVFLGLVLVIIASLVARAIDMKALSWILKTLTDIWVIALIVLFQPELRRLLLFLGRNPIVKFFIRTDVTEYADTIVRAFEELRARHEGALIVIIRTTDIKLFVDTGLPLHAHISKELLVSLFNKRSPLHDGAVVIKDRYIEAARCTLPLSGVETSGERMLGTRHRAAGEFAFAQNGKLFMNLTPDELRQKIEAAITGPVGKQAPEDIVRSTKDYALEAREGIDR
jgi:diadenylate cyclase